MPTIFSKVELEGINKLAQNMGVSEPVLVAARKHILDGNFNAHILGKKMQDPANASSPNNRDFDALCKLATDHIKRERDWDLNDKKANRALEHDFDAPQQQSSDGPPQYGSDWHYAEANQGKGGKGKGGKGGGGGRGGGKGKGGKGKGKGKGRGGDGKRKGHY